MSGSFSNKIDCFAYLARFQTTCYINRLTNTGLVKVSSSPTIEADLAEEKKNHLFFSLASPLFSGYNISRTFILTGGKQIQHEDNLSR